MSATGTLADNILYFARALRAAGMPDELIDGTESLGGA